MAGIFFILPCLLSHFHIGLRHLLLSSNFNSKKTEKALPDYTSNAFSVKTPRNGRLSQLAARRCVFDFLVFVQFDIVKMLFFLS